MPRKAMLRAVLVPVLALATLAPSQATTASRLSPTATVQAGRVEVAGALLAPRAAHSATLLDNGEVLIAGGCTEASCEAGDASATTELYDPATGASRWGPRMAGPRLGHTATRLANGRVLLAGGWGGRTVLDTAEIFDPATEAVSEPFPLGAPRAGHTATLLADGRVLLTGGYDGDASLASAVLYEPAGNLFEPTGSLSVPRDAHAAAALADGRVLVVGGRRAEGDVLASAEVFDPATGSFSPAAAMSMPRHKLAAAAMEDGRVLVVGGSDATDFGGRYASAEVYDPIADRFQPTDAMDEARYKIVDAVVLAGNRVVVAGGGRTVEVFDEGEGAFRPATGSLDAARMFVAAAALSPDAVLIAGGYDDRINPSATVAIWRTTG